MAQVIERKTPRGKWVIDSFVSGGEFEVQRTLKGLRRVNPGMEFRIAAPDRDVIRERFSKTKGVA